MRADVLHKRCNVRTSCRGGVKYFSGCIDLTEGVTDLTDGLDCAIVSDVTDLTLPSTPMGRRSTALFRQAPAMEHSPRPLCQADATAAFPSAAPAKLLVTLEGPPVLAEAGHRSILDTATPEKGRSASKEDRTQISVKPNLRSPRLALRPFRKKRKREHKVLSQCGSLSIESERVDVEAKQNLHCTKEDQSKPFQHVAHGEDSGQMPQPKRRNKQPQLFVHEFVQVKSCDRRIRERAGQLFVRHGWPLREDGAARKSITSLLGLRNQGKSDGCLPPSTHLGWITKATDGGKKLMVAAAIVSLYRYRDRRRCACLEFIVSRSRGAGTQLLDYTKRFLVSQEISKFFSGADLSRPKARDAHQRWGFREVDHDEWAQAGLKFYSGGDVLYMLFEVANVGEEHRSQL